MILEIKMKMSPKNTKAELVFQMTSAPIPDGQLIAVKKKKHIGR